MTIPRPILPKEHGAWAVLVVPMFVAAGIAGRFTSDLVLLLLSALFVFMSYVPVHTILRHVVATKQHREKLSQAFLWATLYLGAGIGFIVPLLLDGRWVLAAIGVAAMVCFFGNFLLTLRYPKTIQSDLVAVMGLSLGAPSAYYVTTGVLDRTAFAIWVLNVLFFGCSVFYVHMKIRAASMKKPELGLIDKLSLGRLNILYHIAVLVIIAVLAIQHFTAIVATIAFVPMVVHAMYGTFKLSSRVRFKNLGLLLLAHSIVFGLLLWGVVS